MSYQESAMSFFKSADKDGNGTLSLQELNDVLSKLGYSAECIKAFFKKCDTSGDHMISMNEFVAVMGKQTDEDHKEAALRRTFKEFDMDGNGEIDHKELGAVFKQLGKFFTDDELKRMIACVDKDHSGTINYEEFIRRAR